MSIEVRKQMINIVINYNFVLAVYILHKTQRHINTNAAMYMTSEINGSYNISFRGWA